MAVLKCLLALALATGAAADPGTDDTIAALRAEIAELRALARAGMESGRQTEAARAAALDAELERSRSAEEERTAETLRRLSSNETNVTQAVERIKGVESAMTSAWLILCGALVMFMHAGFAMLESGCCRAKNASNVLMKNLVNVCLGTIAWYGVGFGFAYGVPGLDDTPEKAEGGNGYIGMNGWIGHNFYREDSEGNNYLHPDSGNVALTWFFQWAFCTVAATIVSGAVAERVVSSTYGVYVVIMTGFIYPVVVAATWGYGWISQLNDVGVIDFAGSGIVHMTGGVSALAGTLVLGPRKDRWTKPEQFDAHNLPLVVLGTFILWFGWYGFNCGSTLEMSEAKGELAAYVAMNTTIAAASGGIVVFFLRYVITKYYDVGGLCNGILAGLVSITAGCGNVECGSALIIGSIGGIFYQLASMELRHLRIDDPVDAVPVHGVCGIWGVMAAFIFDMGDFGSWSTGHFNGWSGFHCMTHDDGSCKDKLFGKALIAHTFMLMFITAWSGILSLLVFGLLNMTGLLRIDEATEESGMDAAKHSPSKAYSMGATPSGRTEAPYTSNRSMASRDPRMDTIN